MEYEVKPWHLVLFMAIAACMVYMIYDKPQIAYDNLKTNCKEDSLQQVIIQLELQLKEADVENDRLHNKFDEIVSEYKFGLNHLKQYQPAAYREFHRVVGFKEQYSHDVDIENTNRLKFAKYE